MQIGDRVTIDGYPATIVALLAEQAFAEGYVAADWSSLKTGILVYDDKAGLVHYPSLDDIHIEQLS